MSKRFYKMWISLSLCVTCITASLTPIKGAESNQESTEIYSSSDFVNGEMVIKRSASSSELGMNQLFKEAGVTLKDKCDDYYVVEINTGSDIESAVSCLQNSTYVEKLQPNYEYEEAAYTGTYTCGTVSFSQNQWALRNDGTLTFMDECTNKAVKAVAGVDVNVEPLWQAVSNKTSKKIIVALIDSGVDVNQPALQGKLWKNTKEIAGDNIDNDGNGYVDDYDGYNTYSYNNDVTDEMEHGTHCAGIIAANGKDNVWGVTGTSNVTVMSVKVFSDAERGDTSNCKANSFSILRGIKYAEANGAKICNLSLGMKADDTVLQEYIFSSNMLFVCATGNDGNMLEYRPVYPACYQFDNVISVANVRCDGTLHETSNYSDTLASVAAPGTEIYSTFPKEQYGFQTGTSMATPYVTGIAALLYSYTDRMDAESAKRQICIGAKRTEDLSGKVSSGLVDAYAAYTTDVSAPVIGKKTTVYKAKGYANVKLNVLDCGISGVKYVRWAKGSKAIEAFRSGANGNKVSATGTIKIKTTGYYTIYAIDNNGNETVKKIHVTVPVPTSLKLNKYSLSLKKGSSYTLKTTVSPSGVYVKYTFVSTNKKVATVTSSGKIIAKRAGKTTIVVKTQNGKRRTCSVTVK